MSQNKKKTVYMLYCILKVDGFWAILVFDFEYCKIAIVRYICGLITFVNINIFYSYKGAMDSLKVELSIPYARFAKFWSITTPQAYKQIALTRRFSTASIHICIAPEPPIMHDIDILTLWESARQRYLFISLWHCYGSKFCKSCIWDWKLNS